MYCPGALNDDLYGGAKPIVMPTGGSAETTAEPALVTAMTLDIVINDFTQSRSDELKSRLAAQYGVHPSLITLQAMAGSLQLTITIATTNGTDAPPIDVATLRQQVNAVQSSDLTASISQAMNTSVTITNLLPPVNTTVAVTRRVSCQRGQWHVTEENEPSMVPLGCSPAHVGCKPRSQV
jgi:hypothetical protein